MEIAKTISRILAWPLILIVIVYQKTLSPDYGLIKVLYPHGYCKFYPSCSEYTRQTLIKDGIKGLPKIVLRIIKCRPGTAGGLDPV